MVTEIDAADWLTLAAAWRVDQGLEATREISSAKLYASEMLARVTDEAIQIYGGMGLMADLPLERFWRDARVERIWDGTSEIHRHIIAPRHAAAARRLMAASLERLFRPKSIAVFGGREAAQAVLQCDRMGFSGEHLAGASDARRGARAALLSLASPSCRARRTRPSSASTAR